MNQTTTTEAPLFTTQFNVVIPGYVLVEIFAVGLGLIIAFFLISHLVNSL